MSIEIKPDGIESCPVADDGRTSGLGQAIHLRRVELGLKRAAVAERAELSYPYISEIENGVKQPSVAALGRIAEALELSVSELAALSERYSAGFDDAVPEPRRQYGATDRVDPPAPSSPRHRPSQLLAPGSVPSVLDEREVHELVRRSVAEELERWEREVLPELVGDELRRRLDRVMGPDR